MQHSPKILLLSSDSEEVRNWQALLAGYAEVHHRQCLQELGTGLQRAGYDAVLCSWSLQDGSWNDALHIVQSQCPLLPVLVIAGTGGEREWLQVLDAGAFDLLVKPYRPRTIFPALEQAIDSNAARQFAHHYGTRAG